MLRAKIPIQEIPVNAYPDEKDIISGRHVFSTFLFAQEIRNNPSGRPVNNLYLNTLGADQTIVSFNYEILFPVRTKSFFTAAGVGIGYNLQVDDFEFNSEFSYLVIPLHFTVNAGKSNSFFECGIGGTIIFGNDLPEYSLAQNAFFDIYPLIGYRLHPILTKKVNFRIYSSFPVSYILSDWETLVFWWFPIGISLGIGF